MEVAAAQQAPQQPPVAPAAPPAQVATAQAPQQQPPAGASLTTPPPSWYEGFKNAELKGYVQERKFTDPEQLAERYQSLEKLRGVPEDRLLKLPEKMEGDEAKAIFQKLGAPKDPKEYGFVRGDKPEDQVFVDWAEKTFHENNLTKAQAEGVAKQFENLVKAQQTSQIQARDLAITQADQKLQKEWGAQYDANVSLARQGAKILGLDAKSLDIMEALQGRDQLFKNLQRIGVSVGESNFVDGQSSPTQAITSPAEAQAEIKSLLRDEKFGKKLLKGDQEAVAKWNEINKLAAPGEKQIG